MISALKRLVANDSNSNQSNSSANPANSQNANNALSPTTKPSSHNTASLINNGMHMISQSLQKKFSRGVNYNMKIVIRGDCNTGKTCLWLRLQGQPFKETYETSDEIKVTNIQWSYKSNDDVVKVEIWDVVDRSKKKRNLLQQQRVASLNTLKLENTTESSGVKIPVEASLDAEFIDVYKNANGCILVYDITKQWTWDYIERELPKIPSHIPVLIIGNHRDMHHHRTVDELKCRYYLENLNRGSLGSAVRYTETSMRTGFGLKYLYKFFNIPFLQLQRENLMQQLEINAKETDSICEELQQLEETIEDDYENFSQNLNSKRRQQQEENAKDVLKNAKTIDEARKLAQEKEAAAAAALAASNAQLSEPKKVINNIINKINTKVIQPNQPASLSMSVTLDPNSKIKNLPNITNSTSQNNLSAEKNQNHSNSKSPTHLTIDDSHDDELDKFLDDPFKPINKDNKTTIPISNSKNNVKSNQVINETINDDDEEEDEEDDTIGNNPMVAAFKETIDSSDEDTAKDQKSKINVKKIELSEEEDNQMSNLNSITSNLTIKGNKDSNNDLESKQQSEFIFVNKVMSSHDSSSSNISASGVTNQQQQHQTSMSNSNNKNQVNFDSFSTTTSISLVNYDTTSQTSNSLPVNDDQPNSNQIKLTNDDFEFLEKMTGNDKPVKTKSNKSDESAKKSSKTSKSKSSKHSDQDKDDDSKTKTKKKKSKSSKEPRESNDETIDNDELSEKSSKTSEEKKDKKKIKKSSKSSSSSKTKSSKSQILNENDDDDDDEYSNGTINIKKDIDYEEL